MQEDCDKGGISKSEKNDENKQTVLLLFKLFSNEKHQFGQVVYYAEIVYVLKYTRKCQERGAM